MIRKIYQKPKCRGIYINAKTALLGNSDTEVGLGDNNGDVEAKRAYGRFASWDEDDEY